jgi:hypothetical protein
VTGILFAGLLPEGIMYTPWFAVLSTFVAINTILYLTIAIIKLLPKIYVNDWLPHRNRRSESRSIYPDSEPRRPRSRSLARASLLPLPEVRKTP